MLRAAYLFIGVGLVVVKWPQLPEAHTLPLYEGVTLCLLTAMSLLAFVGLLRPLGMLPVLVFETAWKVLWLGLVALPKAVSGTLDADSTAVAFNCSFVVLVIVLITKFLAGAWSYQFGFPWGGPPYGDDPVDQEWIRQGMQYYACKSRSGGL